MVTKRDLASVVAKHIARRMGHRTGCAALCLLLLLASAAFANNSKISPDLQPLLANPSARVNVIVQYNSGLCPGSGFLATLPCAAANLLGGVVNAVFTLINAVAGTVPAVDVITLSNNPNVTYISLDRSLGATLDYSANGVNAPIAWNSGWDGTGVGVAIIDSGIYSHPDLLSARTGQSRVVYRKSFIGGQ